MYEQLGTAELCYGVIGTMGEFVLVDMLEPVQTPEVLAAVARGWGFCGTVALTDGVPSATCEPDPDSWLTMAHAGLAVAQLIADRLKIPGKGDSLEWLERLHRLPDTRVN